MSNTSSSRIVRSDQIQSERAFTLHALGGPRAGEARQQPTDRNSFEAGYIEGFSRGREQALAEMQKQEIDRVNTLGQHLEQHVDSLASSIRDEFNDAQQHLAEQLTSLALAVAKRVIAQHLSTDPSSIVNLVNETLSDITPSPLPGQLLLHPHDAALVRTHCATTLGRYRIEIVEDPRIQSGGCRVIHASIDIDNTVETRWLKTVESLRVAK